MGGATASSVLDEPFTAATEAVERRLAEVMAAARARAVDELESYHAFGPKFTKFDDFEPLERQDAETTRKLEREAILDVLEFSPTIVDPKVDVLGEAAVATFVMEYRVVTKTAEEHQFRARGTLVFAHDRGEWLIVHEHFSPFVANG
jgi:ketosteroid isomerase-like protein